MGAHIEKQLVTGVKQGGTMIYNNPPTPLVTSVKLMFDGNSGNNVLADLTSSSNTTAFELSNGKVVTLSDVTQAIIDTSVRFKPLSVAETITALTAKGYDVLYSAWIASPAGYAQASNFTDNAFNSSFVVNVTKTVIDASGFSADPVTGSLTVAYRIVSKTAFGNVSAGQRLSTAYTSLGGI